MSLANVKHFAISTAFFTVLSLSVPVEAHCSGDSESHHHRHHHHSNHSGIAGIYSTYGFDPYLNIKFEGTLVITHSENHAYQLAWVYIDGSTNSGTGIYNKEKKIIAVTFNDPTNTYEGVQLFRVHDDKLTSAWTLLGLSLEGTETAVKIHR